MKETLRAIPDRKVDLQATDITGNVADDARTGLFIDIDSKPVFPGPFLSEKREREREKH